MGNTCRECLVMVLVFWLLVNGSEIGEQAAKSPNRAAQLFGREVPSVERRGLLKAKQARRTRTKTELSILPPRPFFFARRQMLEISGPQDGAL